MKIYADNVTSERNGVGKTNISPLALAIYERTCVRVRMTVKIISQPGGCHLPGHLRAQQLHLGDEKNAMSYL